MGSSYLCFQPLAVSQTHKQYLLAVLLASSHILELPYNDICNDIKKYEAWNQFRTQNFKTKQHSMKKNQISIYLIKTMEHPILLLSFNYLSMLQARDTSVSLPSDSPLYLSDHNLQ